MKKSIIITGCSTGIGYETLKLLSNLNQFKIYACYRNIENVQKHSFLDDHIRPVELDLNDINSIECATQSIKREIAEKNEVLYAIINIAGISFAGPTELIPLSDYEEILRVNVLSCVSMIQHFGTHLRNSGGKVIHMGSYSGKVALPFLSPYAMSKHALEALTDSMRMELRPWNVKVVIIEAGSIDTPIWTKAKMYMSNLLHEQKDIGSTVYENYLKKLNQTTDDLSKHSLHPRKVASKIAKVLSVKNPKPRYLIGWDAHLLVCLGKFLPDRIRDSVLLSFLKLRRP